MKHSELSCNGSFIIMDYILQRKQQMHGTLVGEFGKNATTCSRLIFIKYSIIVSSQKRSYTITYLLPDT